MKTKVLIYCTKNGDRLVLHRLFNGGYDFTLGKQFSYHDDDCNGKIVAECEVEVEETFYQKAQSENKLDSIFKESCLTDEKLWNYVENGTMNLLHISNLKVFDKPMKLSELQRHNACKECPFDAPYACYSDNCKLYSSVRKAPENMMWVWLEDTKYCLISIRPEWVCKILNGEKTIEVRKKVLKGMYEKTL